MAKAGFYAIESGHISFGRDGNWYTNGERIDNPRIALLFSQSIQQAPDGSFFLAIGEERAPITVEDTPYVVRTIETDNQGDLIILLNDGARELLDPSSIELGEGNVLYCKVKNGRFRARFLRPAYYHLSTHFEEDDEGNIYLVTRRGRHLLLPARSPEKQNS